MKTKTEKVTGANCLRMIVEWMNQRDEYLNDNKSLLTLIGEYNQERWDDKKPKERRLYKDGDRRDAYNIGEQLHTPMRRTRNYYWKIIDVQYNNVLDQTRIDLIEDK